MPLLEIGGTSYRRFNAFVGNWGHLHNKKKVFVGMGAPFTEHVLSLLEIGGTSYRRFNAFVGNWGHLHKKKTHLLAWVHHSQNMRCLCWKLGAPVTEDLMPLLETGGTFTQKNVFVGMGAPFTEHVMPLLEIGGTIHTKI